MSYFQKFPAEFTNLNYAYWPKPLSILLQCMPIPCHSSIWIYRKMKLPMSWNIYRINELLGISKASELAGAYGLVPMWHQGIGVHHGGRWQPVSKQFTSPKYHSHDSGENLEPQVSLMYIAIWEMTWSNGPDSPCTGCRRCQDPFVPLKLHPNSFSIKKLWSGDMFWLSL